MELRAKRGDLFFFCTLAFIMGIACAARGVFAFNALVSLSGGIFGVRFLLKRHISVLQWMMVFLIFGIGASYFSISEEQHALYGGGYSFDQPTVPLAGFIVLRERLTERIDLAFSQNEAVLLSGILLGGSQGISAQLKELMDRSGTSYILSMYGYKMACVAAFSMDAAKRFISRKAAFVLAAAFVFIFLSMAGDGISAIRGAIAAGLGLAAQAFGRPLAARNALAATAAAMLLPNPLLIMNEGFLLSFASVIGMIYLIGPLSKLLNATDAGFAGWKKEAIVSVAANITIVPIVILGGDQFSFTAFASNALVILPIPFVMAYGLLFIFISYLLPSVTVLAAIPIKTLLEYQLAIIRIFSAVDIPIPNIFAHASVLLFYYFGLALFAIHYSHARAK